MKKLSKLFVSVFASIILSVTSASAVVSIPNVEILQKDDTIRSLVSEISEEYKHAKNYNLSEEQSELRAQIAQICGSLLYKYGVKSVARFVVPLKVALDGETENLKLESLEKINWSDFLIINDLKLKKLRLELVSRPSLINPLPVDSFYINLTLLI